MNKIFLVGRNTQVHIQNSEPLEYNCSVEQSDDFRPTGGSLSFGVRKPLPATNRLYNDSVSADLKIKGSLKASFNGLATRTNGTNVAGMLIQLLLLLCCTNFRTRYINTAICCS